MARVVKERSIRRNEILDSAQRLVYTKGYEQMTVQDILDDLHIAKGTFFHYFRSKSALLEALIERMLDELDLIALPIVDDANLPALQKLQRFYATIGRWKTGQKEFLLALLRVWYTDDNAIVRQKMLVAGLGKLTPMLTAIVCQGIREGVLSTRYPEHAGEVVLAILQGLGDAFSQSLLSFDPALHDLRYIQGKVDAYTDALERVLGAPGGSMQLVDTETLAEWFALPGGDSAH